MRRALLTALCAFLAAAPAAAKSLDGAIPALVKKLVPDSVKQESTVAVLPLYTLDGAATTFGKYLSERLLTEIYSRRKVNVVDRSLMDKAIAEMKLSATGMIDNATAKQLGKMVGADLLATGSYTDLGDSIDLNARLIETESGAVLGAGEVKVDKDKELQGLLESRPAAPAAAEKEGPRPSESAANGGTLQRFCAKPGPARTGKSPTGPWTFRFEGSGCDLDNTSASSFVSWHFKPAFEDFIFESRARQESGSEDRLVALIFRAVKGNSYYAAGVNEKGLYRVVKFVNGRGIVLRNGRDESLVKPGGDHRLRVACVGPWFSFYVDGKLAATVNDGQFRSGKVGVAAGHGIRASFEDVSVSAVK